MRTTAQLGAHGRVTYFKNANGLPIFLFEESDSTFLGSLLIGNDLASNRQIISHPFINDVLYFIELLSTDSGQLREIKSKAVGIYQRASLLNMAAKHLAQRCLKQVSRRVVPGDVKTAL